MDIQEAKRLLEIYAELPTPKQGSRYFIDAAEHDVVYLDITVEEVPEDSPLGKRLSEITGVHVIDDYGWAMFV